MKLIAFLNEQSNLVLALKRKFAKFTYSNNKRFSMDTFEQQLQSAGVVGAGGAGFPTYQKVAAKVKTVIANGAECEPLLNKDKTLMENFPQAVLRGMQQVMAHCDAAQGIVAIKGKNKKSIAALQAHLPENIRIFEMADVYPAGDEYEVVYHATGKRIPAGGLPLDVDVIVQNIETLYNIDRAAAGKSVTHSLLTVHGYVQHPLTAFFPIGITYREVLEAAGGATIEDFILIDGGAMMGRAETDPDTRVKAASAGIIVMPRESHLAQRKLQSERSYKKTGKSTCDQCSLCTEMCPRYLMGYPIKPHLVMRSLLTSGAMSESLTHWAQACCACNICSLWACPEGLDPRNICVSTKRDLRQKDAWLSVEQLQNLMTDVHPLKEYRAVPTKRLVRRLGLDAFTHIDAPFVEIALQPQKVRIPLDAHIGAPAIPLVKKGDPVTTGQMIAKPAGGLSVAAHASIDGRISGVNGHFIEIENS